VSIRQSLPGRPSFGGRAEDTMKSITVVIFIGVLACQAAPSFGQVIKPSLFPPPCTVRACLSRPRGAIARAPGASAVQKIACPQGTLYNPRKGTCKVMPAISGTP
jgi:hypothetical protein